MGKLMAEGKNIAYPDTATDGKMKATLDKFKSGGYSMSIVMVYADKQKCKKNAMGLEFEGSNAGKYNKAYSSGGYGWALTYGRMAFDYARTKFIGVGNTFAIIGNNNFKLDFAAKTSPPNGQKWLFDEKAVQFKCGITKTCIWVDKVTEFALRPKNQPFPANDFKLLKSNERQISNHARCAVAERFKSVFRSGSKI